MAEQPDVGKYFHTLYENVFGGDELATMIFKGQLVVESALDNIISLIFFHPEHVLNSNMGFDRKLKLARAYALRKDKISTWNVMTAINAVRNEVAHNLTGDKRHKKMDQLRRLYLADVAPERAAVDKDSPDELIVLKACALCIGFLEALENDTKRLREHIDALDATLNAELERVPGTAKT